MEQIELRVTSREVIGKNVRFLRRQGIVPLHLYGHGIESMPLQCDIAELRQVMSQAGKTRLINLKVGKARKPRNVFVREVQRHPVTGQLLHVDLYEVKMEEKMKVAVPIALVGEAPALRSKGSMLTQELNTLSIEALPDKIPAGVGVDVSGLAQPEQAIHVRDIVLDEEITVLDDPERLVVKISLLPTEKEEVVEEVVEGLVTEEAGAEEAAPPGGEESGKE